MNGSEVQPGTMMTKKEFEHVSVMLYETVDALVTDPEGIYVDGTDSGSH